MKQRINTRPRLLTAGYMTLDLIVRDLTTDDFWHSAGGTCGNVSVFAAALGADVSILARTGEDRRGKKLIADITNAGVDVASVESIPALSTPGIVELIQCTPEGGHRFTHQCPLCSTQLPKHAVVSKRRADIEAESIDQFDAFFFDRATMATLHLAAAAREAGLLIMFEPQSVPRTAQAKYAAALSDIVKVSRRPGNHGRVWDLSAYESTRFIIETLGPAGSRFRSSSSQGWSEWRKVPASLPARVKDTAGAGDWMTAGLLTSILPHRDVISPDPMTASIEFGQRLSAISIGFDGPNGALTEMGAPTMREVACGTVSIEFSNDDRTYPSSMDDPEGRRSSYCKLCLTEGG